jgi:plasmid stabilization system protein ParE
VEYKVIVSQEVFEKIQGIAIYIREVFSSEQGAQKVADEIFDDIESLSTFPERGFDADEKVGKQIFPPYASRGIVTNEYLIFYQIIGDEVRVTHLVPAKSDYRKLF